MPPNFSPLPTKIRKDPLGHITEHKQFNLTKDIDQAFSDADLVIVATDWPEYKDLDPAVIGGKVNAQNLVDGRSILQRDKWRYAGWRVVTLGEGNFPVA